MRRPDDYYSVEWAVGQLLAEVKPQGVILDPFADGLAVSRALSKLGYQVVTNSREGPGKSNLNLWDPVNWKQLDGADWIITRIPSHQLDRGLVLSYEHIRGGLATLATLNLLEPTYGRQDFLKAHPPTLLIALPRLILPDITTPVNAAWFVWLKYSPWSPQRIKVVPKL